MVKKYFIFSGLVIIFLVVVISGLSGLYSKHFYCKNLYGFEPAVTNNPDIGPSINTDDYNKYLETLLECNSVNNNIFISYFFIAIGVAFIAGAYITRD